MRFSPVELEYPPVLCILLLVGSVRRVGLSSNVNLVLSNNTDSRARTPSLCTWADSLGLIEVLMRPASGKSR